MDFEYNSKLGNGEDELNEISIKKKNRYVSKYLTFDNLFDEDYKENSQTNYYLGTIHSVKGESFDAVLLILKNKGSENTHYKTYLKNNTNLIDSEELRIVYVGMTRARKLLHVAVPSDAKEYWEDKFLNTSYQSKLTMF